MCNGSFWCLYAYLPSLPKLDDNALRGNGGFANSIYGVIYQRGQFGPASSGRLEARLASGVSASARQAARAALNGSDPTGGAKYFKLASSGHAGTVVGPIVFY